MDQYLIDHNYVLPCTRIYLFIVGSTKFLSTLSSYQCVGERTPRPTRKKVRRNNIPNTVLNQKKHYFIQINMNVPIIL